MEGWGGGKGSREVGKGRDGRRREKRREDGEVINAEVESGRLVGKGIDEEVRKGKGIGIAGRVGNREREKIQRGMEREAGVGVDEGGSFWKW